jgi:hypothetical protein
MSIRAQGSETSASVAAALDDLVCDDGRQSAEALAIRRGAQRTLLAHGYTSLPELTLASGRRADLIALDERSDILIVEIKSSLADFRSDQKWQDYRDFCDRFCFAVGPDFPCEVLPSDAGLIIADRFGGEIVRMGPEARLPAARRKAMLFSIARIGALRLQLAADPEVAALRGLREAP